MAKYEEKLNIELARLLGELDLAAEGEQQVGGNAIDVAVEVDGLRIAVEAKRDFKQRPKAVDAVDRRFKQDLAMLGVALCYPDGATVEELDGEQLTWTVRTREAWLAGKTVAAADWQIGGVGDLAESLRQAPGSVADADKAAQVLSRGLDDAVQSLTAAQRRTLAERLDLPGDNAKGRKKATEYFTAAKRGMLLLAMAMLFHHRLHEHLPQDPPDGWNAKEYGAWPPLNPTECARDPDLIAERLNEAWRTILLVDYRPVFESALVGLASLGGTERANHAVFGLAKCTVRVAAIARGMRHDLLGRIFHRVLDTARYDGSFYTSTAAATLLAGLAIREEDCDWSDVNEIAKLRICDPACGTGTLLMAAAERIHQLRRSSGAKGDEDEALLALHLVEDVLWGYDINLTATHMAASALGMLSPKTKFSRMRIFRSLLGVKDGVASVGSLELLGGQLRLLADPGTTQVDSGEAQTPPKMNLIIMNPPFTRDSLRHDQFSRSDELNLKRREAELFDQLPDSRAAPRSGGANAFLVLANTLVDNAHSAVAAVLPTALATNPVAKGTRLYLAKEFHISLIVTSHDPERIFMSENTSIGEMLIVCRRWNGTGDKPPTTVINLAENPPSPVEAAAVAREIKSETDGRFSRQLIPAQRIAEGDWNAVNFLNPNLVSAFSEMAGIRGFGDSGIRGFGDSGIRGFGDSGIRGKLYTKPLREVATIGPDSREVRDAFERVEYPSPESVRALWYHKTDVTQSMQAQTDVHIVAKKDKTKKAQTVWAHRARFFLSYKLRLPLARVTSVIVPEPALSSIWIPCHTDDREAEQALCAFLNSSIGLLAFLGARDNRVPEYPNFSLDAMRAIPVPDFIHYGAAARDELASAFESMKEETLLSLPQMNQDPVRKALDDAVIGALDLDPEWVAEIRRALSEEPSITGRRFGAS